MGSFNATCGLSNIPIEYNDPIVVLILGYKNDQRICQGLIRPTDDWQPYYLPFRAKYNDYGGIEDVEEDWNTEFIVKDLQDNTMHLPQGENPYHDHEVIPSEIDILKAMHHISQNRLIVRSKVMEVMDNHYRVNEDGRLVLGVEFFHSEIYDSVIHENIALSEISVQGLIKNHFNELKAIDAHLNEILEKKKLLSKNEISDSDKSIIDTLGHLFSTAAKFNDSEIVRMTNSDTLNHLKEYVIKNPGLFNESKELYHDIVERFAEVAMLTNCLNNLGRMYHPQIFGGQNDSIQFHLALANQIKKVVKKRCEDYDLDLEYLKGIEEDDDV